MAHKQRHLNVEQSECSALVISFEVNKFVAYVENTPGLCIAFLTGFAYHELQHDDEFSKYANTWSLPIKMCPFTERMMHKHP
jgi:hypothetical protein